MPNSGVDNGAAERFIAEPKPGFDRRGSPREQVYLTGLLVFDDGETAPCIIVDRSQGGFRIKLLGDAQLPDSFGLIDLLSGTGYQGAAVWRNAPFAGARSLATFDLRAEQSSLGLRLQAAWQAALA